MADVTEPRETVRSRRGGKAGTRECVINDPGPIKSTSIQFPRQIYKDAQKKAIDLDTNASALIVRFVRAGMARYGYVYTGGSDKDDAMEEISDPVKFPVETIPMGETVTSSESDPPLTTAGAGEGGDSGRARRRA